MLKAPQPKPRGKHFKFTVVSGQIVGALYVIPWDTLIGPRTAEAWMPFFQSDQVQGLMFAMISWLTYECWELFKK